MHGHWATVPPEVQAYWQTREQQMVEGLGQYKAAAEFAKPLYEVIAPFEPYLKERGVTPQQAIAYLFNAERMLTQGTPEQRRAAYESLGKDLAIPIGATGNAPAPVDPAVFSLQQQVQAMDAEIKQRQRQEEQVRLEQAKKQIDAFAADPAHPHFDEVSNEIMIFLKSGLSLPEAYTKAVGANPVTFEKELHARLQTEQAKQAENARLDALPKVKAAKAHVRGIESRKTPTEPIGKMEDTLKDTLREIRQRAH